MNSNEIFFITVVLSGFAVFALALAIGTIHDRRWVAAKQRRTRR